MYPIVIEDAIAIQILEYEDRVTVVGELRHLDGRRRFHGGAIEFAERFSEDVVLGATYPDD